MPRAGAATCADASLGHWPRDVRLTAAAAATLAPSPEGRRGQRGAGGKALRGWRGGAWAEARPREAKLPARACGTADGIRRLRRDPKRN